MKKLLLSFFLISFVSFSQVNTEVHLFDIVQENGSYKLTNGKNISNNSGYDSQPSFYDNERIIFSSTRRGNTDIAMYTINQKDSLLYFMSATERGGEYSPQRIPNSKNFSAVRLDNDGLQRFYSYDYKTRKSKEILPDLKVAYPTWFDKNILVSSVIINDSLHLIISDLKKKTNTTIAKNVGRAVHKIPNSELISFVSKENKDYWLLKSVNPVTKEVKTITSIGKTEDVTWLPNGTLLMPMDNVIYQFNPQTDKSPKLFFSFSDEDINNITRMAVNADGTKIALVAEVSPRYLAQEQLEGYNNRDIEAFLKPFAKNVKVYGFPNNLRYEGIENMKNIYKGFFENTPDLHCKILKRIVHKDKVIDHELVTANGRQFKAVAIYEMKNGKIVSVIFM